MNIYIYSDESGVFDKAHNKIFVFGGVIFLSKEDKDICSRKYLTAERAIRISEKISNDVEVKAASVTNKGKGKLYRSLNQIDKFSVIVQQERVLDRIFNTKKDKQRYLDYAYKIGVKRYFMKLISSGKIIPEDVDNLYFYVDEHTTATNGCYELREGLEQEFKTGTYNLNYDRFYPPIFPKLRDVQVKFCNSASNTLVRAADVVSNRVFYAIRKGIDLSYDQNLFFSFLP